MSVRIRVGDAIEQMRDMPAGSIDCIVTDPPYGQTSLTWDRWPPGWLAEARRLLKPAGSMWIFGNLKLFMGRAGEFVDWRFAQDVIWEKHNGTNMFADRFRRVHEQAVQFYRADASWAGVYKAPLFTADETARAVRRKKRPPQWGNIGEGSYKSEDGGPRLMRSVMFCRSEHGRAVHPTQKPLAVVRPLVEYSCPPGGAVLDPFAGSGTTGICANEMGRDAVLIEVNPRYVEIARRRIAEEAPLFAAAAD